MIKMKKYKKQGILVFSLVIVMAVLILITVKAEEGEVPSIDIDNGTGTTVENASCFNDQAAEEKEYSKITYQNPSKENNWHLKFSNIPEDAVANVAGIIYARPAEITGKWTLEVSVDPNSSMIEALFFPSYFQDKENCTNMGFSFSIGVAGGTTTAIEDAMSSAKKEELINLINGNNVDFSTQNNADYTKEQNLVCSYDPTVNKNVATFTGSKKVTIPGNNYCEKECQETVTVTYGPPIATQAGLGIEYEVSVTSKLECKSKSTTVMPTMPKVCVPTPDCNGKLDHHNDKAGPNEEFDACVLSCDGGTYSQSCINKCYQEVYNTSSKDYGSLSYGNSPQVVDRLANIITDTVRGDNTRGTYQLVGGKLNWVSSVAACRNNPNQPNGQCAGYYYYSTKERADLINHLLLYGKNHVSLGYFSTYFIDSAGFVRGVSSGNDCTSKCEWVGCSGTPNKDYFLTSKEANAKYQEQLQAAINQVKSCETNPTVDIKTTTYTVTVENPDHKKTSFSSKNYQTMLEKDSADSTKGTYRFPKAYISNINGEVKYELKTSMDNYTPGGNKFYTSLLSKNTNLDWYNVKVNGASLSEFDKNSIAYNINAKIQNYGFLEWDFNIDCFYALENTDPTTPTNPNPEKPTPPGGGDEDKDPKYTQYIFRPISLTQVFPASEEKPYGRDPRWNWSCSATNTRNANYPINPVYLTQNVIQDKGYTIYDDANANRDLDYEIVLTRETMQKVRSYNAKKSSYMDYDVSCSKSNGMTVCTSKFLDGLGSSVIKKRGLVGCNNQASATTCDTSAVTNHVFSCITYFGNHNYDITNNKYKEGSQ